MADIVGYMHEGVLLEETYMSDLHTHNRKYMEFGLSDINKAALILEQVFQILNYTIVEQHYLRIFEKMELCSRINESFIRNELSVAGLSLKEEKLEDYFSNLIGREKIG